MVFSRLLSVFCLSLVLWSCSPSSSYTPYFNPKQGIVYRCTVSEMTHTLSTENGQKVQRDHNVSLSFHYRTVTGPVAPQGLHIGLDAFLLHEQADDRGEVNSSFGGFEGPGMNCSLDNEGKVMKLEGLDAVYHKIAEEQRDADEGRWRHRFGTEYFARLLEKGWRIFPDGPVRIGDSWNGIDSLNADPHIPLATKFTLVKVWAGVLYIQTDSDVDVSGVDLKGASHSGQVTLRGRQRGLLRVDAETGLILDGQTLLRADGVLTTGTGRIPLHIDSTCSVKGVLV